MLLQCVPNVTAHQRRRTALDRIHLPEIASAIAFDQFGKIKQANKDEVATQIHEVELGTPAKASSGGATIPLAMLIKVVVASGSSPIFISTFQPTWHSEKNGEEDEGVTL